MKKTHERFYIGMAPGVYNTVMFNCCLLLFQCGLMLVRNAAIKIAKIHKKLSGI